MTVLTFGTFDGLHEGHFFLFQEAKKLGDNLLVVAARDSYIRQQKNRAPRLSESERLSALRAVPEVDQALLADDWPNDDPYRLLRDLDFDVLVLGHDQQPGEEELVKILAKISKQNTKIIRLDKKEV